MACHVINSNTNENFNSSHDKIPYENLPYIYVNCPKPQQGYGYIYHLLNEKDEVIYVGQSTCCFIRARDHRKDKEFCKFRYIEVPFLFLDEMETEHIIFYQPPLNKSLPPNDSYNSIYFYEKEFALGNYQTLPQVLKKLSLKPVWKNYYHLSDIKLLKKELRKAERAYAR